MAMHFNRYYCLVNPEFFGMFLASQIGGQTLEVGGALEFTRPGNIIQKTMENPHFS